MTANAASGGANGSLQIIASGASTTWMATVDQPWLTLTTSPSGAGSGNIGYSVAGNPNAAGRVAVITVTPSSGPASVLVVTQAAGTLSISPPSASIGQGGSTGVITVTGDDPLLEWTAVSNDTTWLTVISGSTGQGSGSIQWSAGPNATNKARTATIAVTPLGGVGQTFTVSQQASADPRITFSPSSVNVDGAGGSGSIGVSATDQTLTWTATADQSWLTISSGSGTGNGSFSYVAAPNPRATSRISIITANASRGPAVTLVVTQSGGVLTVSPLSANVAASGSPGTVTLTTTDAALGWTVTSNQPWLTVTSGASGQGSATVQWSAAANTSANGRSATLTITPTGGTGQIFAVNQSAATTGTLTLTPGSASVPASISTGKVTVTSTNQSLAWTVASSDQSWLTISSGASGTGDGSFQYTATGNTTALDRTATITVTPANGSPVTFTVTQAATTTKIDPASATAAAAGATGSFQFTTNNSTLQWDAKSDSPWLTLNTATPGTGDATMNWAAAANTSPVARMGTITIYPAAGQALVFTVNQEGLTGTITVTPSPIAFSYQQLASAPTDVQLQVGGTAGLSFTVSAATASGGNWLGVATTTPATTPGVINVSANPASMGAGTYTGTITITSAGATNSPVMVPVTLTVTAAAVLTAEPNSLNFSFQQNGPALKPLIVQLGSTGTPPASLDFTILPDSNATWLSATGVSPAPSSLTVSVNPAGLQPGTYQGLVKVAAPLAGNSPFTIPVTLTVSAAPMLVASPQSLSVTYRQLDPLPTPIAFGVASSGDNFGFSADVSPPASWLSVAGIGPGTTAVGQTPSTIQISVNPTGLAPGTYQGSIVLMSASAGNNGLTVPVTLTVQPAATLTPQPQQLNFNLTEGVDTGGASSIAVSSDSPVAFTAVPQTASGGSWLSVLSSGAQTPATLTVSVQSAGLAPGTYLGSITLTSAQAANSPVVIPVTLTIAVQPRLTAFPTQLTYFYQIPGGPLPPDEFVLIGTSNLMQAPVSLSAATASGGNWLSAANGVTTPGLARISADPAGLAPGTYSGSVTLTSPDFSSIIIPVTLRIVTAALLSVQPGQLTFSYQQGGSVPAPQSAAVISSGVPLPFNVATAPGASWLAVTGGGPTPSNFSVSVNPQGLAPGSYSGAVMITSIGAGNSPVVVPVQLTVTSAPVITAQPSSFSLTYRPGGDPPLAQALHISSAQNLTFTTSISPQEAWLSVDSDGTTPGTLDVTVDPTGLTTGQYTASILVSAPGAANSPLVVPVTLNVQPSRTLVPSPAQFTFSYQISGPQPSNQVLTIADSTLVVTATPSTTSGGDWLSAAGGGSTGPLFSLSVNPAGLSPGTYQGLISLSAPDAGNSPLNVPVTLVVAAAPVLSAAPTQLTFSYQIGNAPPASGSFQLTSSGSPLAFQVAAATDSGGAWLTVNSGTTTTATVTAGVDPAGLAPGTYAGTITVSSAAAGNSPLLVPVTLTVTTSETLTASPASLQFVAQEHGPSPPSQTFHLAVSGTGIPVTYAVSPGAAWLSLGGTPPAPGDVSVTVSSGALAAGTYTAVILVQSSFAANSPLAIPVTLVVAASPVVTAFPGVLQYSYTLGSAKPAAQMFNVNSAGGPVDYTVSVVPGASWLFASGTGTTPGSVSVTVDPGVLTAGSYQGTVLITPANGNTPIQIPVGLMVAAAPMLSSQPASLAFAYQINGPLPRAATLVVSSSQGSHVIAVGSQILSGGNWLTLEGGGNTPSAVTVSVNPAGLAAGVYQEQIVITAPGVANSPLLIPATLTVSSAPAIIAIPSILSFAALVNGSPANQQITLSSSDGSALPIGSVVASGGGSLLSVSTSSNTTPATLTVSATPGTLSAGDYQASIIVSSPTAANSTLIIPVVLTLSARPSLLVSPPFAAFGYTTGTTPPQPVSLLVSTTDTPAVYTSAVAPGSPWLTATGSGTTPSTLQISVDPSALAPGAYHGSVLVTSAATANGTVTVPVDLIVSGGPVLTASSPSLTFSTTPPGNPPPQSLQITSTGSLTLTTSISPATPWLSVTSPGNTRQVIIVSVNITGLSPGTYQGAVEVYASGAANSPLTIPVTLVINAVSSLQATPSPVSFHYQPGGTVPTAQAVGLTLGGQPAANAQSTVALGTPWLSVTGAGATISITANPVGLLPGTYNSTILVSNDGAANNPLTIPVTLTVGGSPVFDLSQDALAFTAVTAQSQPMTTSITLTTGNNPPVDFTSNVTASTWLTVSPLSGMTPSTVNVTVDPTGLRPGNYSGSVIVSSSGNVIRTIPVNLAVADTPGLNVSPPFLELSYAQGGDPPAPVNVYIARFGADISVVASPDVPWITVNPSTPSASGPITVTVNPAGLAAGIYHGIVTLTLASAPSGTPPVPSKQIPVTLYVNQPATPRVISIVSAMSFLDTPLTPGLIFTVLGTDLGPVTPLAMELRPDQTISETLGGVQVLVNGIPCPLLYVSSGQINAIAPYALYNKTAANVAVRYLGLLSDPVPVLVSPSASGLFTASQSGAGPAAILNQDQSVNSPTNPAQKGSIISLFGGGGGQTSPQGVDGLVTSMSLMPQLMLPVSVTIDGVAATDIMYAGAAPDLVGGAIQVNVRIPSSVSSGDLPVVLRIGNTLSQTGLTVSVH